MSLVPVCSIPYGYPRTDIYWPSSGMIMACWQGRGDPMLGEQCITVTSHERHGVSKYWHRKHQSSDIIFYLWANHRARVDSLHKGSVIWKIVSWHDIMQWEIGGGVGVVDRGGASHFFQTKHESNECLVQHLLNNTPWHQLEEKCELPNFSVLLSGRSWRPKRALMLQTGFRMITNVRNKTFTAWSWIVCKMSIQSIDHACAKPILHTFRILPVPKRQYMSVLRRQRKPVEAHVASVYDKMPFHKISWVLEDAKLILWIVISLWTLACVCQITKAIRQFQIQICGFDLAWWQDFMIYDDGSFASLAYQPSTQDLVIYDMMSYQLLK